MEQLMAQSPWLGWLIVVLLIWSIPWKAMALWRAAKQDQKIWFGVFIIFNTVGLLEIIYLLFFSAKEEVSDNLDEEEHPKIERKLTV
jgi:methionyl-tRNA synthetase